MKPSSATPLSTSFTLCVESLSRQKVDFDFHAFSQNLRHRFTVDVKNAAGEAVAKVSAFGQSGLAAGTVVEVQIARKQAASTKPKNLDICLSLLFRMRTASSVQMLRSHG